MTALTPSEAMHTTLGTKIEPIFREHCFKCHSHGDKIKGGLVLDSPSGILSGGDTGPAIVPHDVPSLLEIAHEMREHEWIAFGVAIDVREQVTPQFARMHRRLQPPLYVVAREAREQDLSMARARRGTSRPALERVITAPAPKREGEHDALALQLCRQVDEGVPGCCIRPLEVLQQEYQWPLLGGETKKIRELLEQERLAAAESLLLGRALEPGVE